MPRIITSAFVAFGVAELITIGVASHSRSQPAPDYKLLPIAQAPAELRPTIDIADDVFHEIRKAHLTEITRALASGGPGGAIQVCHQSSAGVIERVKREKGFDLGRTSDRLRNPTNLPKPWAEAVVKKYAGARATSVDGFYVNLGDRVGVIRPVEEAAICSGCHGPADRLEPRVRKELQDRYPADRATGFMPGEIRGWLWAEIPLTR
jgi:hypothetical protein